MSVVGVGVAAIQIGQQLFGGGPSNEYKATISQLKDAALAGSNNALTRLECLAAMISPVNFQRAVALGYVKSNETCGSPPDGRRQLAAAAVLEVRARRAVGGALTNAGITALGAGADINPGGATGQLLAKVSTAAALLPLLVAGAILIWLVLKRK